MSTERWQQYVQHVEADHPFLTRLAITSTDRKSAATLPAALKVSVAAVSGVSSVAFPLNRLLMVVPHCPGWALWTAIGSALDGMQRIRQPDIPFVRGQKLLLDGERLVEFDSEDDQYIRVKMAGSNWMPIPRSQRIRLQPTNSHKRLSRARFLGKPLSDPLDILLGIETCRNRALFENQVILVSQLNTAVRAISNAQSTSNSAGHNFLVPITKLLPCGIIRGDGRLHPIGGGVQASPVLLIAPGLLGVREFLESNPEKRPLVVIDGSRPLSNKLSLLDEVLELECPTVCFVENHEADVVTRLSERSFRVWAWSPQDVTSLSSDIDHDIKCMAVGNPLRSFAIRLSNYERRRLRTSACRNRRLEHVSTLIQGLFSKNAARDDELADIEGRIYGVFLAISRLLRPSSFDPHTTHLLMQRVENLRREVELKEVWLGSDLIQQIAALLSTLLEMIDPDTSWMPEKIGAFERLFMRTNTPKIAVVVGDPVEAEQARRYWTSRLQRNGRNIVGHYLDFYAPSAIVDHPPVGKVVVCGWLGSSKMRMILESCTAPDIEVIAYPFEEEWLKSAERKWKRRQYSSMNLAERAALIGIDRDVPANEIEADSPVDLDFIDVGGYDIEDSELKLHHSRRIAQATKNPSGEETVAALPIYFTEDYVSFLTENHNVPVVTELIEGLDEQGVVESKKANNLVPGDYVVFREGTQSDVIREIADDALARAGKGDYRALSASWRQALRSVAGFDTEASTDIIPYGRLSKAVYSLQEKLEQAGVKRRRETIRRWLLDDNIIGPRDYPRELPAIVHVTNDEFLKDRLEAVCNAIHEVRGAHLEASNYLAKQLFAKLPRELNLASIQLPLEIDLERFGRARIVLIEEIGGDLVPVPVSRLNCLLRDAV